MQALNNIAPVLWRTLEQVAPTESCRWTVDPRRNINRAPYPAVSVLFGHPTGNPNSHHAALAYFEAGWLESFCVPWMPSLSTLQFLERFQPIASDVRRLRRRHFAPLTLAPKIQGRFPEWARLVKRGCGLESGLSHDANEWLMRTMSCSVHRKRVQAVHAYEDCSLRQFREATRLHKACVYEMPTCYFPFRDEIVIGLERKYVDWLPGSRAVRSVPREQKQAEMSVADVVLAPSLFVVNTIRERHPQKAVILVPYGADLVKWPTTQERRSAQTRFLFVGHCSIMKGVPLLIEAWRRAELRDAQLQLVGSWQLAEAKKKELPANCIWTAPVSSDELAAIYREADIFVFPSNFEGFGLVVLEAMAAGLPVITTKGRGADEILAGAGYVVPPDDLSALVETLRFFNTNRHLLDELSRRAQRQAATFSWDKYRENLRTAVQHYV